MSIAFKLNLKESGRKKSFEQFFVYNFLKFENYLQKTIKCNYLQMKCT